MKVKKIVSFILLFSCVLLGCNTTTISSGTLKGNDPCPATRAFFDLIPVLVIHGDSVAQRFADSVKKAINTSINEATTSATQDDEDEAINVDDGVEYLVKKIEKENQRLQKNLNKLSNQFIPTSGGPALRIVITPTSQELSYAFLGVQTFILTEKKERTFASICACGWDVSNGEGSQKTTSGEKTRLALDYYLKGVLRPDSISYTSAVCNCNSTELMGVYKILYSNLYVFNRFYEKFITQELLSKLEFFEAKSATKVQTLSAVPDTIFKMPFCQTTVQQKDILFGATYGCHITSQWYVLDGAHSKLSVKLK